MGDMITTSKGIVEEGKDLITHAKAIAQRCSDKRMKSDLKALCARIQTIGVCNQSDQPIRIVETMLVFHYSFCGSNIATIRV